MNQILSTEVNKKRKTVSLHTIMVIFGICMIIFGICLASTASYAVYKSKFANGAVIVSAKPEINISENNDGTLTIAATHKSGIKSIVYSWNDGEEATIEGNNRINITENIEMPSGTNTLKVTATSVDGQSLLFEKEYTSNQGINIQLSVVDTSIKISVSGKDEISFITYKWDDEEEKRQDINATSGEAIIEIPGGQHTLTVIAVDINNNTETKTQEVKGVKKPDLQVTQDGANFIVKVSDETGLDKVEFVLNGQGYRVRLEGATEKEFSYPLEDGENTLEVTVYNTNGATATFNALCRK